MGRPTIYNAEIAAIICERLALGESLMGICRDDGMPSDATVLVWGLTDHPDRPGFYGNYARAREIQAHRWAEQILAIADTPQEGVRWEVGKDGETKEVREDMLGHRRLQVDSRKWLLSKILPKRFGEKIDLTHANPDGTPLTFGWKS